MSFLALALAAEVTLAVVSARVWTGEPGQSRAQAVAVAGDRIAAVGSNEEIQHLTSARTQVIDAQGAFLCPGFIQSHAHLLRGDASATETRLPNGKLIRTSQPEVPASNLDAEVPALMRHLAAAGITSVTSIGDWSALASFRRARHAGKLTARLHLTVPLHDWMRLAELHTREGRGDDWVRFAAVKGYVHKASDVAFLSPDIEGAAKSGLQVMLHAMGADENRAALDALERTGKARQLRLKIEHANFIYTEDLPRFGEAGVIASMQPGLLLERDRGFDSQRAKPGVAPAFAFRSLLDGGAVLAFGDDGKWLAPPVQIMARAVALSEGILTAEEALAAFTRGGAYAIGAEDNRGTLARGKYADFVLLADDITRLNPETMRSVGVRMTVVGGAVVYRAPPS